MYIDKLDDIVNEYNCTYHRTIKMKPVDVKHNTYIDCEKLVIMSEFPNTKIFFLKDTHQIGLKKFLVLVKLKVQFHGHM